MERIQSSSAYVNPVFDQYFADPFVFRFEGSYYAVGTGGPSELQPDSMFQVLQSPDLIHWTHVGAAMIKLPGRENSDYWAPEISRQQGLLYMYYSVGEGDRDHQIRVARSNSPLTQFVDMGPVNIEGSGFTIDPHVYLHTDGDSYLYYATNFLDTDRPGTSLVVDRLTKPTCVEGKPSIVARATSDWQRYERNRSILGGRYDWHTLEGPSVVQWDGRVYVFYSGGNWQNESYGVDFVVADHPLGPYQNTTGDSPRVLRTLPGQVLGPGHNSVVIGPDDRTLIAAYHGWNPERSARLMRIDPIVWTANGPIIDGPSVSTRILG